MADSRKQSQTEKAAPDPTVFSGRRGPEYPEGTHPPVDPSKVTWSGNRLSYSDMPAEQKPAEDTVAQVVEDDPVAVKRDEALRKDASSTPAKSSDTK